MEPLQADDPTLVGRFRVVGRLCASGTLLSALGSTAVSPTPGSDPAQVKRDSPG